MKRIAFLILSIGGSYCSLGQEIALSKMPITELLSVKFDTTYFENGQIETITRQSQFKPTTSLWYGVREIKTVYQYDCCGNWRNTTNVFEDIGPLQYDALHYGKFQPRRWQEDKAAISVNCKVPWRKPLIY